MIREFIKNNISIYNNMNLTANDNKKILSMIQSRLSIFIEQYLESIHPEYDFIIEGKKLIEYPQTEEFIEEFRQLFAEFSREANSLRQTNIERAKYGNHDLLYDNAFSEIGNLIYLIK